MLAEYVRFGLIEESSFGVTPSAALNLVNVTDVPLTRDRQPGRPAVYTGDRRNYANKILQKGGSLTVPTLLQYENSLLLLEGLAHNDRSAAITFTASDVSGVGATGVITTAAGDFSSFLPGDWVYIDGVGFTGNTEGWYGPILAIESGTSNPDNFTVPAAQLSNFSSGGSVNIRTRRLRDGNSPKHFTAQWHATQLTNQFKNVTAMTVQQAVTTWEQGSFVTESFTLMGKEPVSASATVGTGPDVAAPTTDFMTGVDDVGSIWIADASTGNGIGAATSLEISNLTLTLQNALAQYYGLGSPGPSAIEVGNMDGSQLAVTARFTDAARTALADKIDAHTTMSAAWAVQDAQGNKMLYFLPALRPDTGDESFGAPGTIATLPVTLSMHDPDKDASSAYAGLGFDFQWQVSWVPAS